MKNIYSLLRRCTSILFVCWLMLIGRVALAQAPAWQTALAVNTNGNGTTYVAATTADDNGNVYIVGDYTGQVSFGATTLNSMGDAAMFVAKWSRATGSFVWVQSSINGANGTAHGRAVAVSGTAVYVTGHFANNTAMGTTVLTTPIYPYAANGFVARLTDGGSSATFDWAYPIVVGATDGSDVTAVVARGNSVYVAGGFTGTTVLGGQTLVSAGGYDALVLRYDDAGSSASVDWAQRGGGIYEDYCLGLAVRGNNVYVAGTFKSPTAGFGSTVLSNSGAGGSSDVFVAKLTDSGASTGFTWARGAGGAGDDICTSLAMNGTSLYIGGDFRGNTVSFGTSSLTNTSNAGYTDGYVAKLTDAGNTAGFGWVQAIGGISDGETVRGLACSGTSVLLTGSYASTSATLGSLTLANTGSSNVFVAKLADAGSSSGFVWAQRAGGSGFNIGTSVAIKGSSIYVVGSATPPSSFSAITLTAPLGSLNFLASITDPTLLATTLALRPESISLFPNPAHGTATVQLPSLPGTTTATLTVLDALGRTLRTQTAATNFKAELDLSGLAPGLYAVRVAAGGSTATQRLVVE